MTNERAELQPAEAERAIGALSSRLRAEETLSLVIENPLVGEFAREGRELSTAQKGLIATVVSIMQDRLIDDLRANSAFLKAHLYRQSALNALFSAQAAAAMRNLYWAPLFTLPKSTPANASPQGLPAPVSLFQSIVTWGNFTAVGGVLILAASLYFTKAYSSLKDVVENQTRLIGVKTTESAKHETDLAEARTQLSAATSERDKAVSELKVQTAVLLERQKTVERLQQEARDLALKAGATEDLLAAKTALEQNQQDLTLKTAEAASATAQFKGAAQRAGEFEKLYKTENAKNVELQREVTDLNTRIADLRVRLAAR